MGGIEQRTIPRQMWAGIREEISPGILAAATFLILVAVLLLITVELLQRPPKRKGGLIHIDEQDIQDNRGREKGTDSDLFSRI